MTDDDQDAIDRIQLVTPTRAAAEETFAAASHAIRPGKVDLGTGKAQHVDLFRKIGLRRELLALVGAGGAYVPFLGEADIAAELYRGRYVLGVELDPDVARTAGARLAELDPPGFVIVGDAEAWHVGADAGAPYAVLDVDAFSNPYRSLEAAWRELVDRPNRTPGLADRVAVFGTDGMRLAIRQSKSRYYSSPTTRKLSSGTISDKRRQWNNWWGGFVLPWLEQLFAGWTIVETRKYQRTHMVYWGVVLERAGAEPVSREERPGSEPPAPTKPSSARNPDVDEVGSPADIASVEKALLEAATSGNVAAAIFWLEHKGGPTWTKSSPADAMLERLTGSGPKRR